MKRFFFILFFLLCAEAQAATYYVAKTGSDSNSCTAAQTIGTPKLTIRAAIACVTAAGGAPHTIRVRTGTYTNDGIDNVIATVPSGTSDAARITLLAHDGAGTVTMNGTAAGDGLINFSRGAGQSYWTIDGINLDCTSNATCVNGGFYINWQNMTLSNTGRGICPDASTCGPGHAVTQTICCAVVIFGALHDNVFTNVIIDRTSWGTVDQGGGNCCQSAHGLYVEGSNNTFDRMTIHDVGQHGAQFFHFGGSGSSHHNTIKNSVIYDIGKNSGTTGYCVSLGGDNNTVFNTVCYNTDGPGFGLGDTNHKVYSNTVDAAGSQGIYIGSGSGHQITNNIVANSGGAIINDASATFTNNLCYNNGGSNINCAINANPLFVNAAAHNYQLQTGSPAINAGAPLGAPYNVDIAGIVRPVGPAYDIGAYEFGAPPVGPPTLTPNPAVAFQGGIVNVGVDDDDVNERTENVLDWVGIFVPGASGTTFVDWFYMNGTKTAPTTAISDATIAFTAPATVGSYEFRFYQNGSSAEVDRLATAPFTVIAPSVVLKLNLSAIKIGPGVAWIVGVP